MNGGGGDNNEQ